MAVGEILREWRQRRHRSQLDLACDAEISTRHLSFVETGRSTPSREMVLNLAERLEIPLRERNALLLAAGYAPVFAERPLEDPALGAARRAMDLILRAHEPYPAIAIDRHWTLVASNRAVGPLLAGVDASLGIAPRIANLAEWRAHLLARLRRQIEVTADAVLVELLKEVAAHGSGAAAVEDYGGVIVPLQLRSDVGLLSLFSTTTVFGTPMDVTLAELAIESFFPADEVTAERLRALMGYA